MCGWVAGLTALAGLFQYRAQQAQADAQASMYRAQADAATQNARIENRKQEQIADNYAQQQEALRSRRRLAEGAQRAETGAAGLNFAGSSMDILSSGADAYQKDAQNLLMNQRNDNYSSRVTESNYINQANQANAAAGNVKRQARMAGFASTGRRSRGNRRAPLLCHRRRVARQIPRSTTRSAKNSSAAFPSAPCRA